MANEVGVSDEIKNVIMRNSDMVYRLAFSQMKNKDDADDVYQEVFYRYIRKKQKFDNPEHEKAWFIRVTLNCSKTVMKSFWKTKVSDIEEFVKNKNCLAVENMGGFATAYLLHEKPKIIDENIEIAGLNLQKIFIKLTGGEDLK